MLCNFANKFPDFVADFLDREQNLKRRFREETITDMLMASIKMIGGCWLIVEFPNEVNTGADMQWDFVNEDNGTFIRILIQAKRLSERANGWRSYSYSELAHITDKHNRIFQAQILCKSAREASATVPIYFFYNPKMSCDLAGADGCYNLQGINWADGYMIEKLVTASRRKPSKKSLAVIYPLLIKLPDLLCPSGIFPLGIQGYSPAQPPGTPPRPPIPVVFTSSGIGIPVPPRPEDIHMRLELARHRLLPNLRDTLGGTIELPALPDVSNTIPDDVLARISRHRGEFPAAEFGDSPKVRRITIISRNTPSPDYR